MTHQNISFRRANAEELRLAALRQLIFEEPVSRLARVKKTIQRQLAKPDRDKIKELSVYQLAALHGDIFGVMPGTHLPSFLSSIVLSLALLLEDFRLYTPAAFTAFVASNASLLQAADFAPGSRGDFIVGLGQKLSQDLALGPERKCWLTVCLLATIDWSAASCTAEGASASELETLRILSALLQIIDLQIGQFALDEILPTASTVLKDFDTSALLAVAQSVGAKISRCLRPTLIVLVEGQSELIVLPHFARLKGEPLESLGAMVIASGGAQQVVRRYLTMKDVLDIPIVCVFDGDAEDSSFTIEEALRDCDGLFCLESRELEDCYSYEQILKILNRQLLHSGHSLASESFDIPREGPRKNALNRLFRSRGLGDFDKIAFAKSTVDLALSKEDVPVEMSNVIDFVAEKCKQFSSSSSFKGVKIGLADKK